MTVQLNIRLKKEQKEMIYELARANNQSITSYILDKVLLDSEMDSIKHKSANNNIDKEVYEVLIEQLNRKDEQIINLQKIIFNKETKLLEYSSKKNWWKFWR